MVATRLADVERRLAEGVRAQADARRPDRAHRARRGRRRAPRRAGGPPSRGDRRPPHRAAGRAPPPDRRGPRRVTGPGAPAPGPRPRRSAGWPRSPSGSAAPRSRRRRPARGSRPRSSTSAGSSTPSPTRRSPRRAPPLAEGVTPAARVRDLEREIRLMGPINPLALEEFTALQERHRFLEEQLEDVRSTRRDLQRVIRSVDAEIQSVFAAAFADVSENFTALFATLFPGGTGRLDPHRSRRPAERPASRSRPSRRART